MGKVMEKKVIFSWRRRKGGRRVFFMDDCRRALDWIGFCIWILIMLLPPAQPMLPRCRCYCCSSSCCLSLSLMYYYYFPILQTVLTRMLKVKNKRESGRKREIRERVRRPSQEVQPFLTF